MLKQTFLVLLYVSALYESGNDGSIKSLTMSANGEKLLITECRNHSAEKSNAYVYDNTDLKERSEPVVYRYLCCSNEDQFLCRIVTIETCVFP